MNHGATAMYWRSESGDSYLDVVPYFMNKEEREEYLKTKYGEEYTEYCAEYEDEAICLGEEK